MSNVSTRHTVNPFIAGKSEPLTGQRLAKIGYKQTAAMTKAGEKALPSVCVSVPMIDCAGDLFQHMRYDGRFDAIILAALETAQDGIIRSLNDSSGGTLTSVSDDEISISACLAYLENERTGGRLSGEFVGAWFDENARDALTLTVAEKLGFDLSTPEQESTVGKHVAVYRALLCSLTGKNVTMQEKQVKACETVLRLASVTDSVSAKLTAKLESLKNTPKIEDLLDL